MNTPSRRMVAQFRHYQRAVWKRSLWRRTLLPVLMSLVLFTGTLAPFLQAGMGMSPATALAAGWKPGKNVFHSTPDLGKNPRSFPGALPTHRPTTTPPVSPIQRPTLATPPTASGGSGGATIHTTANHPWLTADRGWVPAGEMRPGERVVTLGGGASVVEWMQVVPGQGTMYNLTVAHAHTYVVGAGHWVVHNTCKGQKLRDAMGNSITADQDPHHLIPCQCENHPLIQEAKQGGFSMNTKGNGRALFRDAGQAEAAGLPSHPRVWTGGRPHAQYTSAIQGALDDAWSSLPAGHSPADAINAVYDVIDQGNALVNHFGWVAPGVPLA